MLPTHIAVARPLAALRHSVALRLLLEAVQRDRGGPEEEITTAGETELSVLIAAAEERRRRARLGFTARQGEKEKEANDG
ncbi:hypothetical protein ACP4OV_013658 [Aristida adscensionis]